MIGSSLLRIKAMPKNRTTRQLMKRKLEQADGNIETGLAYLAEVWQVYLDPHPDIAEQISLIMQGLDMASEALKQLNARI